MVADDFCKAGAKLVTVRRFRCIRDAFTTIRQAINSRTRDQRSAVRTSKAISESIIESNLAIDAASRTGKAGRGVVEHCDACVLSLQNQARVEDVHIAATPVACLDRMDVV